MRLKLLWVPYAVLLFSLALSVFAWRSAEESVHRISQTRFEKEVDESLILLQEHLRLYFDVLYSLQSFFAATQSIGRDEWLAFNNLKMLQKRVPGIDGIGFTERVREEDAKAFTAGVRADNTTTLGGFPDFQIFPDGKRKEYYVVKFFEPYQENIFSHGFDVLSDPVRREAFERARDTGEITFTGLIQTIKPEEKRENAILIILPIYRTGAPVDTVAERREALIGFVDIVCKMEELLRDIFKSKMIRPEVDFDIFDGRELTPGNMLHYDFRAEKLMREGYEPKFIENREVSIGGRTWTLRFISLPDYQLGPIRRFFPLMVLVGGCIFSFLLFGILLMFSTSRLRAVKLAEKMTEDLRLEIVERKKAEAEARKALNVKSDFVSMVSHELRTPLTAINESIRIVSDGSAGPVNEEQKDFLDTAGRNVDRLSRLISDVLTFQKLESGLADYRMEEADINRLAEEARESFRLLAQNKGLRLETDCGEGIPLIALDRDKIAQVFANLIHNSIKFSDKGTILIRTEKTGDEIKVSVKDEGIGVKKEDLGKLFENFTQLPAAKGRKISGTGLGLAISKKIIQDHEGRILAESEPGAGMMISFFLKIPGGKKG